MTKPVKLRPPHTCGSSCGCQSANNSGLPAPANAASGSPAPVKKRFTLADFKDLFIDHMDILLGMNLRPAIMDNIERVLRCRDPFYGGTMYECPDCGALKFVAHTCKSRFCPSCGFLYSQFRADSIKQLLINCSHRHMVFTIPEELRPLFRKNREALNDLFEAVNMTLSYYAEKRSKTENYMPGFICVLHTFGRDLKWNPHIHALVAEGFVGTRTPWLDVKYFDYDFLRKGFRRNLLFLLRKRFGDSVKNLTADCYGIAPNGFYVNAPKNDSRFTNLDAITKYVCRYLGRPVIALSRIDSYDRVNDTVTFHYTDHKDNQFYNPTVSAMDFIKLLIVHIPDKNFKMIRYYGFYSSTGRHSEQVEKAELIRHITEGQLSVMKYTHTWRISIERCFNVDPQRCSVCGCMMIPIYHSYRNFTHYFDSGQSRKEKRRIRGVRASQINRIISHIA